MGSFIIIGSPSSSKTLFVTEFAFFVVPIPVLTNGVAIATKSSNMFGAKSEVSFRKKHSFQKHS